MKAFQGTLLVERKRELYPMGKCGNKSMKEKDRKPERLSEIAREGKRAKRKDKYCESEREMSICNEMKSVRL